jgi:signal transduction histidine kinase
MEPIGVDHKLLGSFVRIDLVAASLSAVFVVVGQLAFVQEPLFWLVPAAIAVLVVALLAASRQLSAGHVTAAIALVTAGNWIVAVCVPIALPFLWPVLAVTALVPIVLSASYLGDRAMTTITSTGSLVIATVAVIGLVNDDGGVIDDIDDTLELVLVVGGLAALAIPISLVVTNANRLQRTSLEQAIELNEQLRTSELRLAASRQRVVHAADAERIRIERDLHDGAQQRLVAVGVHLRLLDSRPDAGELPDDLRANVSMLVGEIDVAVDELRELAHGIYPPLLEARGLGEALAAAARRSPVPVDVTVDDVTRLDRSIEAALYFTGLEAMTNAAKHAPDGRIAVHLGTNPQGDMELRVVDDGPGFDASNVDVSRGLLNMSDRLGAVGGTLSIDSVIGDGTSIVATVPAAAPTAPPPV